MEVRDVHIKPPVGKEFELNENQIFKLLRPLYGLCDAGDYWRATFSKQLKKNFHIKSTTMNGAFFFKKSTRSFRE